MSHSDKIFDHGYEAANLFPLPDFLDYAWAEELGDRFSKQVQIIMKGLLREGWDDLSVLDSLKDCMFHLTSACDVYFIHVALLLVRHLENKPKTVRFIQGISHGQPTVKHVLMNHSGNLPTFLRTLERCTEQWVRSQLRPSLFGEAESYEPSTVEFICDTLVFFTVHTPCEDMHSHGISVINSVSERAVD